METLLTESMISGCSSSGLQLGNFFRKRFSETAGNFRQNGTQLELIEYHDGLRSALMTGRVSCEPCAPACPEKRASAEPSSARRDPRRPGPGGPDNRTSTAP